MKVEKDGYALRMVKVRDGKSDFYEIRCESNRGVEHLVSWHCAADDAERLLLTYQGLSPDAKLAAVALYHAQCLAGRIAYTTDELGSGLYATKSHMRAWAKEIFETVNSAVDLLAEKSGENVIRADDKARGVQ